MSTSVVLLAYKEAENLKILLPQIHKVMEKLKDPLSPLLPLHHQSFYPLSSGYSTHRADKAAPPLLSR